MTGQKISDAPLIAAIAGTEPIPLGVEGNKTTNPNQLYDWINDRLDVDFETADDAAAAYAQFQENDDSLFREVEELQLNKRTRNADVVVVSEYDTPSLAASDAFAKNLTLLANGQSVKLGCNPTTENFQHKVLWAAGNHLMNRDADLTVEIANGLHDINTFIDLKNGRSVRIASTATPNLLVITGIVFAPLSDNMHEATVTVSTALPARVVAGYAVGFQNIQANGGAEVLNGAHVVQTIAMNRLSFTVNFRAYGVTLGAVTAFDNTTTLGLLANRLIVNQSCLRVNSAAWDGAAREGFINVLFSQLELANVSLTYVGATDEHDMLFAKGGMINLSDYVVIAGAGDKVLRTTQNCFISANRACLGGGTTGQEIWQDFGGSNAVFVRCSMGGVSGTGITATANSQASLTQCILAATGGGAIRTTYSNSTVSMVTGRISQCGIGLQGTRGLITVGADVTISGCAQPLSITQGIIDGNPILTNNGGTLPKPNAYLSQGGVWKRDLVKTIDPALQTVGLFAVAVDVPEIPPNDYRDVLISANGVIDDDFALIVRSGGLPQQNVTYDVFVDSANTLRLRATNHSATAINPTAFTPRFLVLRSA